MDKRIPRVAHLVTSLDYGGLEKMVLLWAKIRNEQYPDSTSICCLDEPGPLAAQVKGDNLISLSSNRSRFPWDSEAVSGLSSFLRSGSCDIIHSHNIAAQQYGLLAGRKSGIKHVHTWHGVNLDTANMWSKVRAKFLCKNTDKIISVSDKVADTMCTAVWLDRTSVETVGNGISIQKSKDEMQTSDLRKELGIDENSFVIGSVGRLEHVKGYDRLIAAFADLVNSYKLKVNSENTSGSCPLSSVLCLVGDGSERQALEAQAKALGVADKVVFAGFRDGIRECYALMDLFVLSSRSEGLPIALLEAMDSGVVAAVTPVGDCSDVLKNGDAGFILPADDDTWGEKLNEIISTHEERKSVVIAKAQERVRSLYSVESSLSKYEEIYESLL